MGGLYYAKGLLTALATTVKHSATYWIFVPPSISHYGTKKAVQVIVPPALTSITQSDFWGTVSEGSLITYS